MENYYDILNIPKNADSEEIKKSFRILAMKYHPDKNPGDKAAEEKFKKVNEAYSILSDTAKRREYDLRGQANNTYYQNYGKRENPFEDIFNNSEKGFETFTWTFTRKNKKEQKLSAKDAVIELLTGLCYILLGIFLIRSFIFLGIFGLILSFSVISNGIRKIKKAYMTVFR